MLKTEQEKYKINLRQKLSNSGLSRAEFCKKYAPLTVAQLGQWLDSKKTPKALMQKWVDFLDLK